MTGQNDKLEAMANKSGSRDSEPSNYDVKQVIAAVLEALENKSGFGDSEAPNPAIKKVIVAVHGIGDQFNYETIQTVAHRFCSFFELPTAIPLGSFHAKRVGGTGAFLFESDDYPEGIRHIGFAEVYWADIPRAPVKEGHTIEESKKWARTIVDRLHFRCAAGNKGLSEKEYEKVKNVLQEMLDTLAVLERVCSLAEKGGVFKFDLRKILVDYLADVQIVTEYENFREGILSQFCKVMKRVREHYPNADIHIVSHSEGTVVAFMGLLRAMCRHHEAPATWDWITKVRGFLTIGSPIDKHLILWPELWQDFEKDSPKPYPPDPRIEWRNFYDYGDPVGFELETTREWLKQKTKLDGAFNFDGEAHDKGFYRYWFPGKAHVDYWGDEALFGYFFQNVVGEKAGTRTKKLREFPDPPSNAPGRRLTTKTVPYLVVAAILFAAVYVLYKAIGSAVPQPQAESSGTIFRNVVGLGSLLAGVTLVARIPRLTNLKFGLPVGAFGFAVFAAIYYFLIPFQEPAHRFSDFPRLIFYWLGMDPLLALAIAIVIIVYWLNHFLPKLGLYTLLLPGFLAVLGMVIYRIAAGGAEGPMWPVVLALAGFLYLWWLAALMFDLVFVWHIYIQNSQAMERLREMTGNKTRREMRDAAKPQAA
ncbi:MAG: hypothetical protein AABO57_12240 [Acidobacteriota bacterium]